MPRVLEMLGQCALLERVIGLCDDDGKTPIYHAAVGGHRSTCALLLEKNADASIGPKLLEPALVALAAAPADLEIQRSRVSLTSKAAPRGDEDDPPTCEGQASKTALGEGIGVTAFAPNPSLTVLRFLGLSACPTEPLSFDVCWVVAGAASRTFPQSI